MFRSLTFLPILVVLSLACYGKAVPAQKQQLVVGVLGISKDDRFIFEEIRDRFTSAHPKADLKYVMIEGVQYKEQLDRWLFEGFGPDVLTWQGGKRLWRYADAGVLADLTDYWQTLQLDNTFLTSAKEQVERNGKIYGIPFVSYMWGIYYNKAIFQKLGLDVPTTWDELLHVCDVLKTNKVVPFTTGTSNAWNVSVWFSYLILRTEGLEFYFETLRGEVSFFDPRIKRVFDEWKKLVDNDYFVSGHEQLNWINASPALYRGLAGMMFIGQFLSPTIPASQQSNIGFFAFPKVDPDTPRFEQAPLNTWIVPAKTPSSDILKQFLSFVSEPQIINLYNQLRGTVGPLKDPFPTGNANQSQASDILREAEGTSQFLDRDISDQLSAKILAELKAFMLHGNVQHTLSKLEQLRKEGHFYR